MMIKQKKTGLFIREDSNFGILVYSPYTGLFFSCLEKGKVRSDLMRWLGGSLKDFPLKDYATSVGAGWYIAKSKAHYPRIHVLSSSNIPLKSLKPDYPILINWLITNNCSCDCQYCYSKDLIDDDFIEYGFSKVKQIANTILSYHPLAVVLTGGDPLSSKNIHFAIEALHGKTGIIVDTNGVGITDRHIKLFKKYNVFVRVSLDSEKPKINNKLRPLKNGGCSLSSALDCINRCLAKKINIGVQTVVTSENMSDIEPLGHKLYRLGITNWRLQILANHSCFDLYKKYEPNIRRFYKNILKYIGQKNRTGWDQVMSIQAIDNMTSNAVVLVNHQGEFLTELNGKVPIDKNNIKKPTLRAIRGGALDLDAHTDRYLNLQRNPLINAIIKF